MHSIAERAGFSLKGTASAVNQQEETGDMARIEPGQKTAGVSRVLQYDNYGVGGEQ